MITLDHKNDSFLSQKKAFIDKTQFHHAITGLFAIREQKKLDDTIFFEKKRNILEK